MHHRLLPTGLRAQLALTIALVTIVAVGASFAALYGGTSSRLQAQIDGQLRTQAAEWDQTTRGANLTTPAAVEAAGRRFIASQRYHAESLINLVQVSGGPTVSNNPDVVGREEANGGALLTSPVGITTQTVPEAGDMRVLAQPILSGARRVGTLRVANPLRPLTQAQSSLRRTFLVVGLLAVVLAVVAGAALAAVISRPLRRITNVAAAASEGDLSQRAGPVSSGGEVGVLATAFDDMLDRLERAFRRQRDFVSDASHELRTPLSVLRAQVELLDHETDERARHEGTTTLLRRLDELDRLVDDMLTLASAESGQLIVARPFDLSDFFEDVRRDLPLFGERDFRLSAVMGTLDGDPDRLTQVLRNLIRNAVAHTGPGDWVQVAARARDGHLDIAVSDSGPGIPADELHQIFERFHRVDASRSRDRGGPGLGLAIARTLVQAHGGRITAESPPGQGATFRIELPGYRASALAAGPLPSS